MIRRIIARHRRLVVVLRCAFCVATAQALAALLEPPLRRALPSASSVLLGSPRLGASPPHTSAACRSWDNECRMPTRGFRSLSPCVGSEAGILISRPVRLCASRAMRGHGGAGGGGGWRHGGAVAADAAA